MDMASLAGTRTGPSLDRENTDTRLLFYGCENSYQLQSKLDPQPRRSMVTVPGKFFNLFIIIIIFCILLYIPIYNIANNSSRNIEPRLLKAKPEDSIAGWLIDTNRDTRIYVNPNNDTAAHEPKEVCANSNRDKKNNLFLLIIVCSSIANFEQRKAIRETWGYYDTYSKIYKIVNATKNKNNLYSETKLAKALQRKEVLDGDKTEKKLDNVSDDRLTTIYMSKELGAYTKQNYGDLFNMASNLKFTENNLQKIEVTLKNGSIMTDFKVTFMLGLPAYDNDITIKRKVEEEAEKYGDIIQEGFIDSYNNLTMKSIMMLKWISNKCNASVRYIMKTDDDTYINVPNLVAILRDRSKEHDGKVAKGFKQEEHLLMGYLFSGETPVRNSSNKWHSPRYLYSGDKYPCFLSGTGYVLSIASARALYKAALITPYFHLEDVYITGMCALRAKPRIIPRLGFSYDILRADDPCCAHNHVTTHHVTPSQMKVLHQRLLISDFARKCERMRVSQDTYTERFKNWMVSIFVC